MLLLFFPATSCCISRLQRWASYLHKAALLQVRGCNPRTFHWSRGCQGNSARETPSSLWKASSPMQALPFLSPKVMSRASALQKKRGNRSVENALTLFQNVRRNLTEAPSFKLCPLCVPSVFFVCCVFLRVFPNLRAQNLECEHSDQSTRF